MEKTAAFNLDRALRKWREQLAGCSPMNCEHLDELETHLRDSIRRLQEGGLSEEEAWLIAQRRLGQIASLEQEFAKLAESSAPAPARRSARLLRSVAAVLTGALVTILLVFVAEWSAFQSLFEGSVADDLQRDVMQDFSTSTQLSLLGSLAGALVGGYLTALIARHHPMKHALTAGGVLWCCLTLLRGLQAESWLLWILIGAAMTSAMLLGAMLCERHRPRWSWQALNNENCRRLARRAGMVSVGFMIAGIVVGLAARIFPNLALEWLHPIEVWLLWGTLAGWSTALCLIMFRKLRFSRSYGKLQLGSSGRTF